MCVCTANVTVYIRSVYEGPIVFIPPLPKNRTIIIHIDEELPVGTLIYKTWVRDVDFPNAVFRYQLNSTIDGYLTIDPNTGNHRCIFAERTLTQELLSP